MPIQNGFEWTQSCNFHSNDLPNLPFSVSLESHKQANDIFRNALSSQQFANETLSVTRPCPLFSAVQINLILHYRNPLLALSQYLFVFFSMILSSAYEADIFPQNTFTYFIWKEFYWVSETFLMFSQCIKRKMYYTTYFSVRNTYTYLVSINFN